MSAYKDQKTGKWYVFFYYRNWQGENKGKTKRGFATKREALEWERNFKLKQSENLDMTMNEFYKLYESGWDTWEHLTGGDRTTKGAYQEFYSSAVYDSENKRSWYDINHQKDLLRDAAPWQKYSAIIPRAEFRHDGDSARALCL